LLCTSLIATQTITSTRISPNHLGAELDLLPFDLTSGGCEVSDAGAGAATAFSELICAVSDSCLPHLKQNCDRQE
jgi:hypothetical protein